VRLRIRVAEVVKVVKWRVDKVGKAVKVVNVVKFTCRSSTRGPGAPS
jgi:hypothetical protein